MSELRVTIPTDGGPITLPFLQMAAMGARIRELEDAGKVATWHPNACGCCITVHENAEHVHEGWVIGPDGGTDWVVADD